MCGTHSVGTDRTQWRRSSNARDERDSRCRLLVDWKSCFASGKMIHPAPSVTTDMADDPTGCGSGAPRGEKIRYRRGSGDLRSRERGQVRTRGGAKGRFIRHAGLQAPAVLALAVAMVLTPFRGLLMAAVGVAALQAKGFLTATGAAVTLAPVTTPAEVKHHTTGRKVTYTPTKDCGAGNRHRFREGAVRDSYFGTLG